MAGVGGTREEPTRQERPLTGALYSMPSLEDLASPATIQLMRQHGIRLPPGIDGVLVGGNLGEVRPAGARDADIYLLKRQHIGVQRGAGRGQLARALRVEAER